MKEKPEIEPNITEATSALGALISYIGIDLAKKNAPMLMQLFEQDPEDTTKLLFGKRFHSNFERLLLEFHPNLQEQVTKELQQLINLRHTLNPAFKQDTFFTKITLDPTGTHNSAMECNNILYANANKLNKYTK